MAGMKQVLLMIGVVIGQSVLAAGGKEAILSLLNSKDEEVQARVETFGLVNGIVMLVCVIYKSVRYFKGIKVEKQYEERVKQYEKEQAVLTKEELERRANLPAPVPEEEKGV